MFSLHFSIVVIFGLISRQGVSAQSVQIAVTNGGVGLLGDNVINITCTTSGVATSSITLVTLQKKSTTIATFLTNSEQSNIIAGADIAGRAALIPSTVGSNFVSGVTIQSVVCADAAEYQCKLAYLDSNFDPQSVTSKSSMTVEVAASTVTGPPQMSSTSLQENQTVTFTCDGSVGNPAGSIKWSRTKDSVTEKLTGASNQVPESCWFKDTSTLTYTVTRDDNGAQIGCSIDQPKYVLNPSVMRTDALNVYYVPSINGVNPEVQPSYPEGTAFVRLTCHGEGNPEPDYKWVHEVDSSETGGQELVLTNLKINQTGDYTCVVNNSFNGVSYSDNRTYLISIVETTTNPPTTTTIKQSTSEQGTGTPKTDTVEAINEKGGLTEDEKTIIIVVVVLVVVIVIIIIGVVIFVRRRGKKQAIEEPPEKPRNNQDLSFYSNKPDLVSSDEKPSNLGYNNDSMSYKNEDGLNYAVFNLDDKPRSRKPLNFSETTPYAEIAMPSV
ncbi:hypothetical protein ScPMuIL_003146 [Solemya velum]